MKSAGAGLAIVSMLASCGVSGTRVSGPALAEQESALFECKNALGVGGESQISILVVQQVGGPDIEQAVIEPHDMVTPELAAQINRCAVDRVMTSAVAQSDLVPADVYVGQSQPVAFDVRQQGFDDDFGSSACPPGFRGLYRGSLIC